MWEGARSWHLVSKITSSKNTFCTGYGDYTSRESNKETKEDMGVHEALPRRDELQCHCQGSQGDPDTVSKHYELIQKMLGTKENAPLALP